MTEEAQGIEFTKEQQELVDKRIGVARMKARDIAKAEFQAEADKAKETQEQAQLAAKEEWEKLAQTHKARADALEPLVGQMEKFNALIEGMLKDKIKELGDKAKAAVEALPEAMDALSKLEWLNKNVTLFQTEPVKPVGTPKRPDKKEEKGKPRRMGKKLRL